VILTNQTAIQRQGLFTMLLLSSSFIPRAAAKLSSKARLSFSLARFPKSTLQDSPQSLSGKRYLSFSFAGPRTLDEILKKDLVAEKTGSEVSDLWYSYHDGKEDVIGLTLKGPDGRKIVERAR
jgi:hypothetical protein